MTSFGQQQAFSAADDYVFGEDEGDMIDYSESVPDTSGSIPNQTYFTNETSNASPLLSAAPIPPSQPHPAFRFDNQYRSPANGSSPTFSEASTVSPKDIFGDDNIMKKTYPSLFSKQESAPHSHSPLAATPSPIEFDESTRQPIFAPPDRQTSMDSYLSTSSEDEETAYPLFLPEPNVPTGQTSGQGYRPSPSFFNTTNPRFLPKTVPSSLHPSKSSPPSSHHVPHALAQSLSAVEIGAPPSSSQSTDDDPPHPVFGGKTLPPKQPGSETKPSAYDFEYLSSTRWKPAQKKRSSTPTFTSSDTEADAYRSSASDVESNDGEFSLRTSHPAAHHSRARRNSAGHHPHAAAGPSSARVRGRKPRASEPSSTRKLAASGSPAPFGREGGSGNSSSTVQKPPDGELSVCPQCPTSFVRHYDLKRHLDTVHPEVGTAVTGFWCDRCERQFSRKDALIRHQKTIADCSKNRGKPRATRK